MHKRARNHKLLVEWKDVLRRDFLEIIILYDGYYKNDIYYEPQGKGEARKCGYDDGKHTLDVREWTCPSCGMHHDRDIKAAKNILRLGTSLGKKVVTSA